MNVLDWFHFPHEGQLVHIHWPSVCLIRINEKLVDEKETKAEFHLVSGFIYKVDSATFINLMSVRDRWLSATMNSQAK